MKTLRELHSIHGGVKTNCHGPAVDRPSGTSSIGVSPALAISIICKVVEYGLSQWEKSREKIHKEVNIEEQEALAREAARKSLEKA